MLNSKNILLGIIVTLILYIGNAVYSTYDEVTQANDMHTGKKFSKAAHETAYGPVVKKKKLNGPIDLELYGTIDKSMAYSIRTLYKATSDKKSCKSYSIWSGGSSNTIKDFEYKPNIEGETHHIKVSLRIFNPEIKCKFKPIAVYIRIFSRDNKKHGSETLFLSRNHRKQYHRFKYTGSQEKMDIECVEPSLFGYGEHFQPCGYKPLKKRFDILGILMNGHMKYQLNIGKLPLESLSEEEKNFIQTGR